MFYHKPVLLEECIEGLNIKFNGIYVDGTLGLGGHSRYIARKLTAGKLISIDRDINAINMAKERLSDLNNVVYIHDNHYNIESILKKLDVDKVDGILLDLGVSSYQLDDGSRGFSYMKDAKLDMRMNTSDELTAYDVVNNYSEEGLAKIFFEYGEERYSKRIAKKICEYREKKSIDSTLELVEIIKSSVPAKALHEKQHPAKRVFQAIRIEVNSELIGLKEAIIGCIRVLKDGGRLAIISFHSLEDKIVKHTYEMMQGKCTCPSDFPVCICNYKSYGKIVNKKPIEALDNELEDNHRARSAKLRVFEKKEV